MYVPVSLPIVSVWFKEFRPLVPLPDDSLHCSPQRIIGLSPEPVRCSLYFPPLSAILSHFCEFRTVMVYHSSVGIVTGYGLDGPGIEYRWGRDVSHTSRPDLGPTQSTVQWVPCLYRG
jgi:hypothetical protein